MVYHNKIKTNEGLYNFTYTMIRFLVDIFVFYNKNIVIFVIWLLLPRSQSDREIID